MLLMKDSHKITAAFALVICAGFGAIVVWVVNRQRQAELSPWTQGHEPVQSGGLEIESLGASSRVEALDTTGSKKLLFRFAPDEPSSFTRRGYWAKPNPTFSALSTERESPQYAIELGKDGDVPLDQLESSIRPLVLNTSDGVFEIVDPPFRPGIRTLVGFKNQQFVLAGTFVGSAQIQVRSVDAILGLGGSGAFEDKAVSDLGLVTVLCNPGSPSRILCSIDRDWASVERSMLLRVPMTQLRVEFEFETLGLRAESVTFTPSETPVVCIIEYLPVLKIVTRAESILGGLEHFEVKLEIEVKDPDSALAGYEIPLRSSRENGRVAIELAGRVEDEKGARYRVKVYAPPSVLIHTEWMSWGEVLGLVTDSQFGNNQ
jgi:hypothetical protein